LRDVVQAKLYGSLTDPGTGMIPADCIGRRTMKRGTADTIDTGWVRHVSGGWSTVTLKSYQQGDDDFTGEAIDFVWLDEEPPRSVYTECLMRTMTTDGCVLVTFTPLNGATDLIRDFLRLGFDSAPRTADVSAVEAAKVASAAKPKPAPEMRRSLLGGDHGWMS
jgi:phage terminase large subunit-like protein